MSKKALLKTSRVGSLLNQTLTQHLFLHTELYTAGCKEQKCTKLKLHSIKYVKVEMIIANILQ